MTDKAKRPKGGWQSGGLRQLRQDAARHFEKTDYYTVKRPAAGVFEVRHFHADDTPCCACRVEVLDRDRQGPDPDPDVNALQRSYRWMEKRHGTR